MFHLYGLIVGVAMVVGWAVAERIEPKINLVAPKVLAWGVVGARMYHVIDYWGYYKERLIEVLFLWNGGLAIWGGIMGGLAAVIFCRCFDIREIWKVLAAMAVAMPLSQAIGRVANGVNGEFGERVMGVPWWSAEMGLNLLLFFLMQFVSLRGFSPKSVVGVYLLGYGGIRLWLEGFRVGRWEIGELPVASVFAVIAVIMGIWLVVQDFFVICRNRVGR